MPTKESFVDKATGIPKTFVDRYDLSGRWGYCTLKDGTRFKFDKKDFDLIKVYRWRFNRGRIIAYGINQQHNVLDLKRVIMAEELTSSRYKNSKVSIAFKNQNNLDYRRSNLIIVEPSKQNFNRKKSNKNTSGVMGVNRSTKPKDKWRAYISYEGKQYNLGFYDDFDEAVRARLLAEIEFFGELAPQKHLFKNYDLNWKTLIRAHIKKVNKETRGERRKFAEEKRLKASTEKYNNNINNLVDISKQVNPTKKGLYIPERGFDETSIEAEIEAFEELQELNAKYYQPMESIDMFTEDWAF